MVQNIFRTGRGLAVIVAIEWSVRRNQNDPISPPLERRPRATEIFVVEMESAEMRKTGTWKIERDKKGKIIFPLVEQEESFDDEKFIWSSLGTYSISKQ